jgi:diguanylate cyclase (GGDEF)-like protein/PAS domain S-box-containing protein
VAPASAARHEAQSMLKPATPADESARLEELRGYEVLDTAAEPEFDRLTRLAQHLFEVPIALVSLVDANRQWFKSKVGLEASQTSREVSFCGHALLQQKPFIIPDAAADQRFADNPLVTGAPHIRFYAGAQLINSTGRALGTLCIIDRQPRELSATQQAMLVDLAALVVEQLESRRARLRATQESDQLRGLIESVAAPISVHQNGVVLFANTAAERLLGVEPGGLAMRSEREFVVPNSQTPASTEARIERRLRSKDGNEHLVQSIPHPVQWRGKPAFAVVHRDIGAERELEVQRRTATELVERQLSEMLTIFDELPEGIVVFDPQFRCTYANRAMGEIFDVSRAQLLGWTPDDAARHVASMSEAPARVLERMAQMRTITDGQSQAAQFVLARPRHRVLRRELHKLALVERPWIAVWTDVTREAAELKLSQTVASTDALTLLPNRRAGEAELEAALAAGQTTVVMFDVDHFKRVNDTFGHDVGDEVLVAVADALRGSARAGDFVARWGGEEFLAVLRTDVQGAVRFAERVRLAVQSLTTRAGPVTISSGVATVVKPSDVKLADEKLYEAKKTGRNRVAA